jgi:NADH-ubiquinone oxidoreductase chain 2
MVIISLMILIIAIALTPSQVLTAHPLHKAQAAILNIRGAVGNGVAYDSALGGNSSRGQIESGISPVLISRLTSIVFLFSGALSYNALYIQSIGSGLSIYSGLFQVTVLSQSFDLFIFILASLILIPWSNNFKMAQGPLGNSLGADALRPEGQDVRSEASRTPQGPAHKAPFKGAVQDSEAVGYTQISLLPYATGPIVSEYSLILLFSTLGSSLLLSSGNLLSMYLSIELQSFGVYILATIYRNSESATSAGLKYFLLGGLSSCLILLGCVLIYSYTGLINFEDIYSILITSTAQAQADIGTVIQLGVILIFIGLLFKIAAAPFHNWAPDVYNDVPTIVTTWLTIMPKIAILILSFEIISTINLEVMTHSAALSSTKLWGAWALIKNLLLISSFLSLIIGTIVGLAQIKIKRLLAYSTISHVGFLLLALSINTEESLESLLFYLIQYSFTNLNAFFILLSFGYILKKSLNIPYIALGSAQSSDKNSDINFISELKGQFVANPLLSLSLAISLFSMAGIPPLIGFFAKAEILYSATHSGYYFISIVAIIVSVISAYYYLQIIKVMHFDLDSNSTQVEYTLPLPSMPRSGGGEGPAVLEPKEQNNTANEFNPNLAINNTHSFIISTLTLSLLLFILKPSILLNSIHLMALNIFYS